MSETRRQPNTEKLPCPQCGSLLSKVVDTRYSPHGPRRRRECKDCHARYSTIEVIDFDGRKSA